MTSTSWFFFERSIIIDRSRLWRNRNNTIIDCSQLSKCYSPGSTHISTNTDDPFTAGFMLVITYSYWTFFQLVKVKSYALCYVISCYALLSVLHWLPVQSRITFKIACLTYKVLTTGQPYYLRSLLHYYTPHHSVIFVLTYFLLLVLVAVFEIFFSFSFVLVFIIF